MLKLHSIRARLWVATALPAMLVIALLVGGFAVRYGERMAEALRDRGVASAMQLGSAAEFLLFAGDKESLSRLAEAAVRSDPHMRGVTIYSAEGNVLAEAGARRQGPPPQERTPSTEMGRTLVVTQPVYPTLGPTDDLYSPTPSAGLAYGQGARLVGYAVVEMSLDVLAQQQRELLLWSVLTAAGGLVLAGALATRLASRVTAQIGVINGVVERVGQGELEERVDVRRSGVLQPLAEGINAMIARIETTQEELQFRIEQATRELRHQKEVAEQAARTDALTGVATRLAFTEAAEVEMQRALRYKADLSLLMMDIDHFKAINDNHGHVAGDAVLSAFARTVQQQIRNVDFVARMGGEEFVVLLPNANAAQAKVLAERIRTAVHDGVPREGNPRVTVSIGVAQFDWRELSLTRWLSRADAALYEAKARGRNCVVCDAEAEAQDEDAGDGVTPSA